MIEFKTSPDEARTISKIAGRAVRLAGELGVDRVVFMDMEMDITACHCNGTPLRLNDLLNADDANFGHDVFGIRRFINRKTGKMGGCFLPRFAEPVACEA